MYLKNIIATIDKKVKYLYNFIVTKNLKVILNKLDKIETDIYIYL